MNARSALLVGLLSVVWSTRAVADDDPARAAHERFRAGARLFAARDWAGARAAFEQAYRILPDPRMLANIATCHANEGHAVEAVRAYRRFLHDGADLPERARRVAEREIADLRRGLADLFLAIEPPGADVLIDGSVVGTAPLPWPVAVAPGTRVLEVRAEGHVPFSRAVDLRAGEESSISVVLQRRAAEPLPPPVQEPTETPDRTGGGPEAVESAAGTAAGTAAAVDGVEEQGRDGFEPPAHGGGETPLGRGPLLWTGVGVTGALAIAALVTGLSSLSAANEYEDPSTPVDRRKDLFDETRTLSDVTDVLVWTAVVTAAATTILFVLAGPERTPEDGAAARDGGRPWRVALSF